jgi:N-methylhydantoinase B/oxoprolinase/acetone carboxylase alpha subunit
VRNLLKKVARERGTELHAVDYLDDGTPIELTVSIDDKEGSAVFDFQGTGPEMIGVASFVPPPPPHRATVLTGESGREPQHASLG